MNTSFNKEKLLQGALARCIKKFGEDITESLYFRIRDNVESFDLTRTLKRSFLSLIEEGVTEKAVSAQDMLKQTQEHNAKLTKKVKK